MVKLEIITVDDNELHKAGVSSAYELYQGDLFRGYIVRAVQRDPVHKTTNYLVYRNPKGKEYPIEIEGGK